MNIPVRIALSAVVLSAVTVACSSADPSQGESVGEAQEAICLHPPCTRPPTGPTATVFAPPAAANPPTQTATFQCSGWTDATKQYNYEFVAGMCLITKPCDPTVDPHCVGYTIVSKYICPASYPYLHCNAYGACFCSIY